MAATEGLDTSPLVRPYAQLTGVLVQRSAEPVFNLSGCAVLDAAAVEVWLEVHTQAWRQGVRLAPRALAAWATTSCTRHGSHDLLVATGRALPTGSAGGG